MEDKVFRSYTAKIGLPKAQWNKKSEFESKIQYMYPGIKIEFLEDAVLKLIDVSINTKAPPSSEIASVLSLTGPLQDLIESLASSN
jgi:hypothetical protein